MRGGRGRTGDPLRVCPVIPVFSFPFSSSSGKGEQGEAKAKSTEAERPSAPVTGWRTMILECPQFTIPPWVSINGPMPVDFVNHPQVPVHHIPSDVYDSQSSVSSGSSHYSDSLQSAVSDASSFTEGYPDVDSVSSMSSVGLEPGLECKDDFMDPVPCGGFPEPHLAHAPFTIPIPVC